jgi:hypothetical protein
MNKEKILEEIQHLKYSKYQLLFLSGKKTTFERLMKTLPGCSIQSVRQLLLNACQKQNITKLDAKQTADLAKQLLPRPKQEESIALIDNELFLKYNLFSTTMKSQVFQNKLYFIHIPTRYRDVVKNERIIDLEAKNYA